MHCGPPNQNFRWAMADPAHAATPLWSVDVITSMSSWHWLDRDKAILSSLVCRCVYTADTDKTRQSCLVHISGVNRLLVEAHMWTKLMYVYTADRNSAAAVSSSAEYVVKVVSFHKLSLSHWQHFDHFNHHRRRCRRHKLCIEPTTESA